MSDVVEVGHELNNRQELFLSYYLDPENKQTYLNKVQAYLAAYPTDNYQSAASNACKLLKKSKIVLTVQDYLKQSGVRVQDRVAALARIMHGEHKRKVTSLVTDKEGNTYESETTSEVSAKDVISAVDTLNKMDGLYTKNEAVSKLAQKEFGDLKKEMLKNWKNEKPPETHVKAPPSDSVSE